MHHSEDDHDGSLGGANPPACLEDQLANPVEAELGDDPPEQRRTRQLLDGCNEPVGEIDGGERGISRDPILDQAEVVRGGQRSADFRHWAMRSFI
jgi:hypothetical protein